MSEPKPTFKQKLIRRSKFLFAILLCLYVVGCTLQRKLVFPAYIANARMQTNFVPGYNILNLQRNWIEHDQGKTEYWLITPDKSKHPGPRYPLLVFTHGNAELIDDQAPIINGFKNLGFIVALCEYRGYGRSTGSPTQQNITKDHTHMIDLLKKRPDIDPDRIVYYGRSVGGGVACDLATKRPPQSLILQSTFRSLKVMAGKYLLPPFLVSDPFDNEAFLKTYDKPTLIMHGKQDTIIPYAHSLELKKIARQPTHLTFLCGHNNFPVNSPDHWLPVKKHLQKSGIIK